MKNKDYISLKEASQLSGYSPDYIGQLIRAGKLPGKQVFQQVVWVTTEKDVLAYIEKKQTPVGRGLKNNSIAWFRRFFVKGAKSAEVPYFANRILSVAVTIAIILFLLLFYIFSSSVEQRLNQNAIQTIEKMGTP